MPINRLSILNDHHLFLVISKILGQVNASRRSCPTAAMGVIWQHHNNDLHEYFTRIQNYWKRKIEHEINI
jgi:hypothetical protein